MAIVPASGAQQPDHHAQRRRLAGAVGTNQRVKFAAAHAEIERVDRGAVEPLTQAMDFERDGMLEMSS